METTPSVGPIEPAEMELPEQVRLLEINARALAEAGNHGDAERLFSQVLQVAPRNITALQYLATRALFRNELEQAQSFIERAIRINPERAELHQNLGIVLRARGFLSGALMAFDHALYRNPRLAIAWVQRGDILQGLEKIDESIASYRQAEQIAGNLVQLAAANGPRTRYALERAAGLVHRYRKSMLDESLDLIRRNHPKDSLARCETALSSMIQETHVEYADPQQRPMFCYVPNLSAKPFYDAKRFSTLRTLETSAHKIEHELRTVLQGTQESLQAYVNIPADHQGVWRDLNHSPNWSSYHFYQNGRKIKENCDRCPETTAAIESLTLVRMQAHAPEVFFSILKPGTRIPPHYGLANYKLAVHLPLIIPENCGIQVGDVTQEWTLGQCLVFDDSFEHSAWNLSSELRAVLILEVWHPDLRSEEREFLATALSAIDRFNRKFTPKLSVEPPSGTPVQT